MVRLAFTLTSTKEQVFRTMERSLKSSARHLRGKSNVQQLWEYVHATQQQAS